MDAAQAVTSNSAQEATASARDQIRVVADQVVGQVFYGTLLRQLRSSSLAGKYGHGGRGEEVFQAQLDQVLATRAGQARSTELSEAMVSRYERKAAAMMAYRREQKNAMTSLQSEIRAADAERAEASAQEVGTW